MSDAPPRAEEPDDEIRRRYTREELLYGDRDSAAAQKSEDRAGGSRDEESDRPYGASDSRRPPLYKLLTPYRRS